MRKIMTAVTAMAIVLSLSATAFAAGPDVASGDMPQQTPGDSQQTQFIQFEKAGAPSMDGELPAVNGEAPDMMGQPPQMDGQAPDINGQPPQMDGQAPDINGQPPFDGPGFIDFESMAKDGVISQDTLEKIMTYMEENRPEGLPDIMGQPPQMDGQPPQMDGQAPDMMGQPPQMDGQAPDMNGQPPQMDGQAPNMNGGLLNDLMDAGVITQAEYDALVNASSK